MSLLAWGYTPRVAALFAPYADQGWFPGRVVAGHGRWQRVTDGETERLGTVSGRLRHRSQDAAALPAVGDWVAFDAKGGELVIHAVVPRLSRFCRRASGTHDEEQVVAANIDTVFLMTGLDGDYNPRRIERALTIARESGAAAVVVVLSKSDLLSPDELAEREAEVGGVAGGVPVVSVSPRRGDGLAALAPWLEAGRTVALIGSSGVGKSTLLNRLLGVDRQRTASVRESDSRGRHTTSRRELLALPGGALVLDTPGLRELQLWGGADGLDRAFADVLALAKDCRFGDCRHGDEPGCAVRSAAGGGSLPPERLTSYLRLAADAGTAGRSGKPRAAGRTRRGDHTRRAPRRVRRSG